MMTPQKKYSVQRDGRIFSAYGFIFRKVRSGTLL